MNKHLYRIVFNKARGQLMVVAENVTSNGKAPGTTEGPRGAVGSALLVSLRPLRFALMATLGLISLAVPLAQADIVADHGAPPGQQPGVINSANGVPQVNIQTPSAAGVSRNTYSQFDVNQQGAILNNSRNSVQTQLGGWIDGNQNLANGTARVILNEVNGSNPSQLRGYVEVAGDRAQVVIANPAGIACDGCGFINANRATLTTGTAQIVDGQLQGYEVRGGRIAITGKGLDASQTDFTDVIARSVEVNAGVWANDLRVTAGANQVNADNSSARPIEGNGEKPSVAIDVAQLGGMYAGKIMLVGTESGVGVRNAGQIGASAGDVVISADGRIGNSGQINATANVRLDSNGGIDNSGSAYAKGDTALSSRGDIHNSGIAAAQQNVSLNANGIVNDSQATLAAGVQADGSIGTSGRLDITATRQVKSQGATLAGGDLGIAGADLDLKQGQASAQNIRLSATANADLSGATLDAGNLLAANIAQKLTSDSARLAGTSVQLQAHDLSNRKGEIIQTGSGDMTLALPGTLDNSDGRIASNAANLTLGALNLNNRQGRIEHAGSGTLKVTANSVDGRSGSIASNGQLQASLNDALLDGASTVARQIGIDAASLSNRQGEILQTGAGTLRVSTSGLLDNSGGTLAGNGGVQLDAGTLLNQSGTVQAAGGDLQAKVKDKLDNASGTLAATGNSRVEAGELVNAKGKVTASGTLDVSAGKLNNDTGTLAAKGALTARGGSISNRAGTLGSVDGSVAVDATQGSLDNRNGRIEGQHQITLSGQGVLNGNGLISAGNLKLDSNRATLDNQNGVLIASDGVELQTGALNNQGGLVQATGLLRIDAHGQAIGNTDSGASGGLLGKGGVILASGDLDNSAGFIGGKGDLDLTTAQINNARGGLLTSEGNVRIKASGLDNRGGQLQTLGDAVLDLASGRLDNAGSLLRAGGKLLVTAGTLDNRNTLGTDQGLEGHSLTLSASQIDNQSGAVRADETLTLNSSGQLDNSGGLVSSSKNLNILDGAASKSLAILNHNGKLIAGQKLSIDSRSLGGDGQTLSLGDISLKLSDSYVHSGQLQANGSIDLQTAGNLDNQARLVAGQALKVTAGNLNNTATGELSATNLTLDTGGTLTNRGLLDGQTTRVNAGTLNNLGSGRIYGDQLSVSAGALRNDVEDGKAAVIAARNRLDIGVGSLLNREHALLFSAGDLYIGGALDANGHATGSAGEIRNASATIEALGDMGLASAVLRNTNEHFSTQEVEVSRESILEYQLTGSTNRYRPEQISIYNSEVDYLVTPEGEREDWNLYNYTRVTRETQILSSDPAQILAGGNLRLDVADALNDKSRIIAGGTIGGNLGRLENTEAPGERVTTESGIVTHFYRIQKKGRDKQGADNAAYNPAASIVDIFLKPGAYLQNTAHVGSGTQVGDLNLGRVDQPASGAGAAQVNVGNGRVISPVLEVAAVQTKNDAGVAESIRTGGIDTRVPDNSLFQVNPQATSGYLIESDPRFTNYRAWLSSDYMLDRLKLDPGLTLTRLGDGFYEQKLIREQIAQLTGRRFLDGYGNDETQYRALLDNGLTYAQAWNLVPGVALTPEQMAQLTSDIVWLVAKDVTLPDGSVTRALVPQVYVRVRQGDIDGSGALMAGQNVDLNIQNDLVNSGTLAGRDVLSITAQNIQNLGGRLTGTDVGVKAAGDLNNLGGLIDASHSLTAVAGRDINLTSSTQDSQSAQGSATRLSRVAGLFVSDPAGELIATAGRDLNLNAAQVVNSGAGGKTTLGAGNDINLGTVAVQEQQSMTWNSSNWRKESSAGEVASSVQGQGDVRLIAGHDLNSRGASVTSEKGAVQASADHDVNLTASQNNAMADEAHKVKSKTGWFSSKTIVTRDTVDESLSQGSTFSGETTYVSAGNDIKVEGSNVVSNGDTTLVAGRNVTIASATDHLNEQHSRDEKKSGLFSGGGIGFTIGSQQQSVKNTDDGDSAAASTVGSINGNVNIKAGEAYRQVGSKVSAPSGDVNIEGRTVDIVEAQNAHLSTQESKFKQSGLSVTLTNPIITAVQTAQQMKKSAERTDDNRMKALAAANVALEGAGAASAVMANPAQAGGINISISIGASKNESRSEQRGSTAAGSSVSAGRDVNITASGAGKDSDLTVQGSQISAGRDANLKADGDIALLAAKNTVEQHSTSKGSSASIGIGFAVGGTQNGFTINAGASQSRGNADGKDLVWSNTHVDGGRQVNLQSGGDTQLHGAVVSAPQVTADVGGNLSIESLQDTSTYDAKQSSKGVGVSLCIPPFCYGASSGSVSSNTAKQNSNYASVTEQSGIKAGDGGFDIRVNGNTDLKGGLIASSDAAIEAGRNRLSTATLTQADIHNAADAKATSSGVNLSSDMVTQGKYGVGKAIVGNALNSGKDSGSSSGDTRSAISAGTVVITDDALQQQLTGQNGADTVAGLNRDTANAHTAAERQDVDEMRRTAEAEQAIKNETYRQAVQFTDDAYRKMFLEKARMFVILTDDQGNVLRDKDGVPLRRELDDSEKANLQAGGDGRVHIANNGIFNDENGAARYAAQHSTADGPQYFIWFPDASNSVSELLIAGYQKYLENDFWGLANATVETREALLRYGETGLHIDGHSRGSMTTGNAMESIARLPDPSGSLSNTTLNFYGPAYNAAKADDLLAMLQNRDAMSDEKKNEMVVQLQNHKTDPVGGWIGWNPGTGGTIPDDSNALKEIKNVAGGKYTVHNCYGNGDPACQKFWQDMPDKKPVLSPVKTYPPTP